MFRQFHKFKLSWWHLLLTACYPMSFGMQLYFDISKVLPFIADLYVTVDFLYRSKDILWIKRIINVYHIFGYVKYISFFNATKIIARKHLKTNSDSVLWLMLLYFRFYLIYIHFFTILYSKAYFICTSKVDLWLNTFSYIIMYSVYTKSILYWYNISK